MHVRAFQVGTLLPGRSLQREEKDRKKILFSNAAVLIMQFGWLLYFIQMSPRLESYVLFELD